MTQEEKAKIKAYNNAIKKAKEYLNSPRTCFDIEQLYNIFPELRKSEDNMIKEELIKHLKDGVEGYMPAGGSEDYARWLAWVEKQGEQEPVPDWMPKFLDKLRSMKHYFDWDEHKDIEGRIIAIIDWITPNYFNEKQDEQEPIIEMKSAEESLGISSEEYNDIVNECLYGESNSSDKEPKFNVGDWITNDDYTWKVIKVEQFDYILQSQNGNVVDDTISHVDEQFHLWTINDAKDGDVLVDDDNNIFIFDGTVEEGKYPFAYCGLTAQGFDSYDIRLPFTHNNNIHPATWEQRNLLFQKMYEAGYEWDDEKKELKKIDTYCQNNCKGFQETGKCFADGDCKAKKNVQIINKDDALLESAIAFIESSNKFCEWKGNSKKDVLDWIDSLKHRVQQKQEWTEEDIRNIENIDSVLFYDKDLPEDTCMRLRNWLQSLKPNKDMIEALRTEYEKGRADTLSEMKSSWSEEDEKTLNEIFSVAARASLRKSTLFGKSYDYIKWQNWLKSLRDRVQPQPKQEWSEEDEKMIGRIRSIVEKYAFSQSAVDVNGDLCEKEYIDADNWLKSLRHQKQWKPSNEQIEALENLVRSYGESGTLSPYDNHTKILYSLLYDLKNLNN